MIICGIEFTNKAEFFKCLNYSRSASQKLIEVKYGSYENLLKVRLKNDSLDECKKILLELRDKYRAFLEEKKNHFEVSINRDVLEVLSIFYNLADENQKVNIVKTFCLSRCKDEKTLNDKIRQVVESCQKFGATSFILENRR